MQARDHTDNMLQWWRDAGITSADLAIRRHDTTMIWHHEVLLGELELGWARAENVRKADVYIRPARAHAHPVVFLDDLHVEMAARVARKYDCLVVHTSPQGGCHLWLRCSRPLDENQRRSAQRWIARRVDADPASTSGEHLGRLAGFRNWKRGCWVNVLDSVNNRRAWIPRLDDDGRDRDFRSDVHPTRTTGVDNSPSAHEWAWVCSLLESGCDPRSAYLALVERARYRRGNDTERYAKRTVERATAHVAPWLSTRKPREIPPRRLTNLPS